MRSTVPKYVIASVGMCLGQYWTGAPPNSKRLTKAGHVALAGSLEWESADDDGYFWCTHGHEYNDCIHSKRVSGGNDDFPDTKVSSDAPTLIDNKGEFYFMDQYLGTLPLFYGDKTYGPTVHIKSYGRWGYIATVDLPGGGSGSRNFAMGLQLFFADYSQSSGNYVRVYEVGTSNAQWAYPYVRVGCKLDMESVSDPSRKVTDRYSYSSFTGSVSSWSNSFGLCTKMIDYILHLEVPVYKQSRYWSGRTDYAYGYLSDIAYPCFEFLDKLAKEAWSNIWHAGTLRLDGCYSKGWLAKRLANIPTDKLSVDQRFIFHEVELYKNHTDPYLVSAGQDLSNYWRNVLIQQAYLDALQSVPRLNDNSISNIIELAGFVKALVVDHRIEIPKSLSDTWLSYRYVYTTGKLDAQEAIDFVNRYTDLGTLDKWIKCFGVSHVDYTPPGRSSPVRVTCRCRLRIRPRDVAMLSKIWRALYTYGLQPNFYVIWDMIPYSFIVDWLIPIGKLASVTDASRMYSSTYYEIEGVQHSFSYDIQDENYGDVYHQYVRFLSPNGVTLNEVYFLEEDPVSTKVLGFRILDGLSLIIG